MDSSISMMRIGIERFLRNPLRIVFLVVVVVVALIMGQGKSDWEIAGNTFQWAAMVAGLLACSWSTEAILDDRDAHRLEPLIASGYTVGRYLGSKVVKLLSVLALPGILLVILGFFIQVASGNAASPMPFLAGFAIIYLPIVIVALGFGMGIGTLTRNKALTILLFTVLWIAGILLMSPESQMFDVSGESLNTAFFKPIPSTDNAIFDGVPSAIVNQGIAAMEASRAYAQFGTFFLGTFIILAFGALSLWLNRCWNSDASALINDSKVSLHVGLPQRLLELKVMKVGRLLVLVFGVLALGLFMFLPYDTRGYGDFLIEFVTPVCFALLYAGIYPNDEKAGVVESQLCLAYFRRSQVRRVILIMLVAAALLSFQALFFGSIMETGTLSVVVAGLAPVVLLGGLAYFLGVVTGSESMAAAITIAFWMLVYMNGMVHSAFLIAVTGAQTFLGSMGVAIDIHLLEAMPGLLGGLVLFIAGLRLLGKPEKLILR